MTDTELISEYMRRNGRKGGRSASAKLTSEERTERARNAANARWRKDLATINAELDALPDCARCGCPMTPTHDRACTGLPV